MLNKQIDECNSFVCFKLIKFEDLLDVFSRKPIKNYNPNCDMSVFIMDSSTRLTPTLVPAKHTLLKRGQIVFRYHRLSPAQVRQADCWLLSTNQETDTRIWICWGHQLLQRDYFLCQYAQIQAYPHYWRRPRHNACLSQGWHIAQFPLEHHSFCFSLIWGDEAEVVVTASAVFSVHFFQNWTDAVGGFNRLESTQLKWCFCLVRGKAPEEWRDSWQWNMVPNWYIVHLERFFIDCARYGIAHTV